MKLNEQRPNVMITLPERRLNVQFYVKKAAMKLSSLPIKMSVYYRNRTYNRVLGAQDTTENIYNS